MPSGELRHRCGVVGVRLQQELRGHSCLPLVAVPPAKQETCVSRSFSEPVTSLEGLRQAIATYLSRACEKLRRQGQRAGSVTYHVFAAGTSAAFFALFLLACEAGARAPAWWPAVAAPARDVLGVHRADDGRLRLRWHVAEVFGENALALYLLSDPLGDHISDMVPDDCPQWYFILWGEGLYFAVAYVAAAYLRKHKLFLRL
jgi:hypothetical protein